jgi:dienelactone hydrolase
MSRFFKILTGVLLVLIVVAVLLGQGKQPQPFAADSQSAHWLQPGPLEVLQFDEVFVDTSRATMAHGDYAGSDERRLAGTVWYPGDSAGGPWPLVVYSHGFSSTRKGGVYLAEQLASLGYVVVAVDYPLTHFSAPDRPYVRDVVNQPADISFLIDTLVARSAAADDPLYGMVDADRIGVTGISLGGMTSTLVAYHPDMADLRIGAALSIAGPTAQFAGAFFTHRELPFLMLAGDIDALVPYRSNAAPVLEKVPGSQLVTVRNASHTGFAGPAAPLRYMSNPDALGCSVVEGNIADDMEAPWYDLLGTPEQGIDYSAQNELCLVDPLPPAMNVLRQHMITSVVVSSFFQSQFAPDSDARLAAQLFLSEVLATELGEVSYAAAP